MLIFNSDDPIRVHSWMSARSNATKQGDSANGPSNRAVCTGSWANLAPPMMLSMILLALPRSTASNCDQMGGMGG